MMPREAPCVLVAFLTLLCPRIDLYAADTKSTSQAVVALDSARADAQVRRDFTVLDRILGDDLTYIHASGLVQGKAEFIADLKSGKRTYTSIKYSGLNVRLLRGSAVITGHSDIHVIHEGKENDLSLRVTEVYVKRKKRWQLIAYQATRVMP